MQAATRKTLTIWWVVLLALMIIPIPLAAVVNLAGIAVLAAFAAIPLAIVTYRRSERDAHLQRPGWYHAALWLQILIAGVGGITAAQTVFADGRPGLIAVATVQLATAILTWRAYSRPGPRRAIAAALVAGFVSFGSIMIDIAVDLRHSPMPRSMIKTPWAGIAVLCAFVAWVGAGFVCLAVVRAFGARTNLPDARLA